MMSVMTFGRTQARITEAGDTTIISNQTINNEVTVNTNGYIMAGSTTVGQTGKLTLIAGTGVTLTGGFTVQLGGVLSVFAGRPYPIRYIYDAAGNRTMRVKDDDDE